MSQRAKHRQSACKDHMLFRSATKSPSPRICSPHLGLWRRLMVRQSLCSPHTCFVAIPPGKVFFPWHVSYSLESQRVLSSLMPCVSRVTFRPGMFHITFILGSHVLRQLVSVNDQATALRSARPLSHFKTRETSWDVVLTTKRRH